jgi:TldD protein
VLEEITGLMEAAAGRCDYADARWVARAHRLIVTVNGRVERLDADETEGVGVRVRAGGGWGFAGTSDLSRAGLDRALSRALAVAEAQPAAPASALAPVAPARGHWAGPCEVDPLEMALDDQVALLVAAGEAMRTDKRIVRTDSIGFTVRTRKAFASTEGAGCTQELTEAGGGISAVAVADGLLQRRSYPGGHVGDSAAGGWELVTGMDLPGHAPRVAEEVLELLTAPPCPAGETTLVLHGEQVALQVHESVGHPLELDRMLGGEASYAGTSWVAPGDVGTLRYGSPAMTVTADATLPGALGSYGWDDEGVPGSRFALVEEGVLRGALSSRESAAAIGADASGGCMRAEDWSRQPIVRMTNVSLEPGEAGTLGELLADTGEGIYLETNRSWSIDDRRLNFQFGCEVAREIRDGELGRLYRDATYAGITPRFWASLDAVCSRPEWHAWGLVNCGKGEPGQVAHVSHGAAPARFRGVQVGPA